MTKPATRLINLIMLLQKRPNQKAADLADELGVSVRTLHRYFAMLDEMGIPIYAERGPCGGFSLVRGYKMPPLMFTPEEAAAISLGTSLVEELWGSLYRQAAHAALAKLEAVLPEQQRDEVRWARSAVVATGLTHPGLDAQAGRLENLRRAIREKQRVELLYLSSSKPAPENRKVDPYALAFRWGWWYVIGYCHRRQAVRMFRIDRIEELRLLKEVFQAPEGFDAHAFLANSFQNQPQVQATLKFTQEGAQAARLNSIGWSRMEEQADGSVVVSMAAHDLNWAACTVLAFGPIVEVLEPAELRQLVQAWAEAIAARNGNGTAGKQIAHEE